MIYVNSFSDLENYVEKNNITLQPKDIIKVKNDFVIYTSTKEKYRCNKCYFSNDCFPFGNCCVKEYYNFKKITEIEMLVMEGNK